MNIRLRNRAQWAVETLVCLAMATCVATAGARLGSGVAAFAAVSLLIRKGWSAAPDALALFAFPDAFACLWALDALRAAGPLATADAMHGFIAAFSSVSATPLRHWSVRLRLATGALGAVVAVSSSDHLSRLPLRARRATYWRGTWRTTGPAATCSVHRACSRWLLGCAAICVIHPFLWRPSLIRRLALIWFAVDTALKS
jgi:hypothetical protein